MRDMTERLTYLEWWDMKITLAAKYILTGLKESEMRADRAEEEEHGIINLGYE